jgi:hypothetical protein
MQETTALPRPELPRPEGGKALARLALFETSRGVEASAPALTAPPDGSPAAAVAAEVSADTARAAAYAAVAEELAAPAPAGTPAWRWLGPTTIPNGQTYGSARVDVAGRIASIAVDPSQPSHVLVGAAGGGVWESHDSGSSWAPRTDTAPTLTTGVVTFDPHDPSVVYVGTGEGNWYRRWGAGVLKSTDGGTTFSVLARAPFVGLGFYDLVVHPTDASRLIAATTGGIHLSTDGGVTWTSAHSQPCYDLSIARRGRQTEVLAACSDGLFQSVNGGTSFTSVSLSGAPASWNRLAVSHAPSDPSVAHLWGASGATASLYRRSGSGTGTWAAQSVPANDTGQAWYDWFCATAPDNPDRVYLGAIHAYRGELSGSNWTWENISSRSTGDSVHPDQHAIAFDPVNPDTIYLGNDGGMFRSPDRGTTWTSLNHGLGITEVEYLAQRYGSSKWLVAGTQDNGSMRYTGSPIWEHVADGDGGDCGVNRADPNYVYHTYYGMGMERSTTGGGWGSFAWVGPNVPQNYSALFYPPVEVNGSSVVQAGSSAFGSRDGGSNFTEVALPGGVASAMYAPNGDRVYVGTTGGAIYRLDWIGSAWGVTTLAAPASMWISDLAVDASSRLWVTGTTAPASGRVYRSDDGGSSWTDHTPGLPDLPMNAVETDPANGNRLWVAADLGVYETRDAGATWSVLGTGLPNSLAVDLVFHPHARVLRAGTRNRGVWEIAVDGPDQPWCGTQWHGSLTANQSLAWFTFNWPASWHVIWTVMPTTPSNGSGRQLTWSTSVERASDEFATYWITVTNLTGATVEFDGRFCVLSRS